MSDVASWLDGLGLGDYAQPFAAQKIRFELLTDLEDADLRELGVAALGDRKLMLKAIAALKASQQASPNAGPASSAQRDGPVAAAAALHAGAIAGPHAEPVPAQAAPRHEAERRQLTVMFCDLVGSTVLSNRLDPEDLQQVVRTYHDAVARAVAHFDGHVAQFLGDGVLVYFGYPRAHEDDAARAVRAALRVIKAVAALETKASLDSPLQTRIGIATGRVVVGEIGSGTSAAEQTASGDTPNLAARLQNIARPGEIVLSAETRRLLGYSFDLETMGQLELKGFSAPVEVWRVLGERTVASRFEAQHTQELTRFIGRDSEVSLLLERWGLARDGEGQVVLLSAEAGIGKSRICQTFRERLAGEPHAVVLLQCSPYFSSSPLYPVVQYFERVTDMKASDTLAERAVKLELLTGSEITLTPASLGYFMRLMGLPDEGRIPAVGQTAEREKALTLQAPIDLLRGLAQHQPVLLLIEDAHWIDPSTEELLEMTIEQLRETRLLVLVTCRPEYVQSWGNPSNLTRLALSRLSLKQCVSLVEAVTGGKSLPPEVLTEIIRRTDGIPLFVEELTKSVLESGLLEETPTGYRLNGPLPAMAIPSTLQDSLMARLDRLAPAKEVAQVGAVIGREFSQRLLLQVLQMPEPRLDQALDELVRSELVFRRVQGADIHYTFKHALIRDTAYSSMLKSQRVLRHGQIAAAIEALEPDTIGGQPELLAYHHQEGGNPAAAFKYWSTAGDLAERRSASREGVTHYRAALSLLPGLPGAERKSEIELQLQLKLGTVLMQTEGFASHDTAQSFSKARALSLQLGRIDDYVASGAGVAATLWSAGRFDEVVDLFEQLTPDDLSHLKPMSQASRLMVLGLAKLNMGELAESWQITEGALHIIEDMGAAQRRDIGGADARVVVRGQCVNLRVHQGFLAQADAFTREAIALAAQRGHPPTQAWALGLARFMAYRNGDMKESARYAREVLDLSERLGFNGRIGPGLMMLGRALVADGQVDEGIDNLRRGFALWASTGAKAVGSEFASHAAEVLVKVGHVQDAAEFLVIGERFQQETGERFYGAELQRVRGLVAQAEGDVAAAKACFRRGFDLAKGQGAMLFALRSATELTRLCQARGAGNEGADLLRPIYEWFTEGFDNPDLVAARTLLGALR